MATRSRLSLAVLVAAASLPAIPTTASAVKVRDGSARITLAPAFQQSLANKDVTVSPTGAASRTGNRLTLKIRRGVNPKRGRARLRLGGGLRWSLGDFTGDERVAHAAQAEETILGSMAAIVGSRRGRITGRVRAENADRERLFKLSRVRFSARQGRATATVSLARAGARELNQALQLGGTLSFRPGELVGPLKLCLGLDPAEPQC